MHEGASNISLKKRSTAHPRAFLLGTLLAASLFLSGTASQSVGLISSHAFHTLHGHFLQARSRNGASHVFEAQPTRTTPVAARRSRRAVSQLPQRGKRSARKGQGKKAGSGKNNRLFASKLCRPAQSAQSQRHRWSRLQKH